MLLSGKRTITYDEFTTFLAEAASIVNNTPLSTASSDPNDPIPITPAMILLQRDDRNFTGQEEFSERDLLSYGPRRWRRIQYVADLFWQRWHSEYLQSLTTRKKWTVPRRSLTVGDIVLIKDQGLKRNYWPMGKVKTVKTSQDGRVRSATITIACNQLQQTNKECERPISQLVLLIPVEDAP